MITNVRQRRMLKLANDIIELNGEDKSLGMFYAEQLAKLVRSSFAVPAVKKARKRARR